MDIEEEDRNEDKSEDKNAAGGLSELLDIQAQHKLVDKSGETRKLPEQYRIPGESDEWGSFDDLIAKQAKHLRPDEIGDKKLDIMSGMDKLVMYVTNKIENAFIYTRFRTDSSRFQGEFVAIAVVAGKTYTSTYLTPGLAIGMADRDIEREGDIILGGLIANLGQRVFGQPTPHIPDGAFMSFEYTEKW